MVLIAGLTNFLAGYFFILTFVCNPINQADLKEDYSVIQTFGSSIYIGFFLGSYFSGRNANIYGRKSILL